MKIKIKSERLRNRVLNLYRIRKLAEIAGNLLTEHWCGALIYKKKI